MVTYSDLFDYTLVLIGLASLIIAIWTLKKKEPPRPRQRCGGYFHNLKPEGQPSTGGDPFLSSQYTGTPFPCQTVFPGAVHPTAPVFHAPPQAVKRFPGFTLKMWKNHLTLAHLSVKVEGQSESNAIRQDTQKRRELTCPKSNFTAVTPCP